MVADSSIKNAFAFPGGHIVVYTGMLRMLESQEEWAGLLAHEGGHIHLRHGMRQVVRAGILAAVASLVFGDVSGLGSTVMDNAGTLVNLRYGRQCRKRGRRLRPQPPGGGRLPVGRPGDPVREAPQAPIAPRLGRLPLHPSGHGGAHRGPAGDRQGIRGLTARAAGASPHGAGMGRIEEPLRTRLARTAGMHIKCTFMHIAFIGRESGR